MQSLLKVVIIRLLERLPIFFKGDSQHWTDNSVRKIYKPTKDMDGKYNDQVLDRSTQYLILYLRGWLNEYLLPFQSTSDRERFFDDLFRNS